MPHYLARWRLHFDLNEDGKIKREPHVTSHNYNPIPVLYNIISRVVWTYFALYASGLSQRRRERNESKRRELPWHLGISIWLFLPFLQDNRNPSPDTWQNRCGCWVSYLAPTQCIISLGCHPTLTHPSAFSLGWNALLCISPPHPPQANILIIKDPPWLMEPTSHVYHTRCSQPHRLWRCALMLMKDELP